MKLGPKGSLLLLTEKESDYELYNSTFGPIFFDNEGTMDAYQTMTEVCSSVVIMSYTSKVDIFTMYQEKEVPHTVV